MQDFIGLDLNVSCLSLGTTQRLMDHDPTVGEAVPLALEHTQRSTRQAPVTSADYTDPRLPAIKCRNGVREGWSEHLMLGCPRQDFYCSTGSNMLLGTW
jgi:hypothetical protein